MTGQFRILCDGQHGEGIEEAEEEIVEAIAQEQDALPASAPPITPPL
jgi:hypothetical protein